MPEATVNTSKPRLTANIRVGGPSLDMSAVRQLAQHEPEAFMGKMQALIDAGKLSWQKISNVRDLYRALSDVKVKASFEDMGEARAITTSAFPLLSGGLTVAGVNAAYEAVPTIGQDLVTDMEDNKRFTVIAGVQNLDKKVDTVAETVEFPEIGASEEKFHIGSKRNGRRISISKDMIEENDLPNIVQRVNALGDLAAKSIEKQTLRRVTDRDGSAASAAAPWALTINGTGTQLYNSTANLPGTRAPSGTRVNNNALVDETDLDAVRTVLAAMKDDNQDRIAIPMSRCTLLVPDAVAGVALTILRSERLGVEGAINIWGPRGEYMPKFRSSPLLDDLSSTAWYLGWFEQQFVRKWKLKMEYTELGENTESYLRNRIAFQARLAWNVEIGARDYVYVVQSLSGTTAPSGL